MPEQPPAAQNRLLAVDALRGLIMMVMALDHARAFVAREHPFEYWGDALPQYNEALPFVTRVVTHLCAPTFVFLAGVSILFQKANGKSPAALSRFLLTRGLWLIFLEATVISFGFNFGEPFVFLQTIWSIGMGISLLMAEIPKG